MFGDKKARQRERVKPAAAFAVAGLLAAMAALAAAAFPPHQVSYAQGDPSSPSIDFDLFNTGDSGIPSSSVVPVTVTPPSPPPPPPPASPSAASSKITTISGLFARVATLLNTLVPFITGLAVLVIIWGVLGYIARAGEEEKRREARQFILWGILGLFAMLSVWGLVNVLVGSFSLEKAMPSAPALPCIPNPPTVVCE